MTAGLAVSCVAIVAASLLGGLLPLATVLTHLRLQAYLSFAAGAMLGAAFFHMLPEAGAEASPRVSMAWAAAGLLALFFLERFFAFHRHEAPDGSAAADSSGHAPGSCHDDHALPPAAPGASTRHRGMQWRAAAFGLAVHSLVGGVALASTASAGSAQALMGVVLATLVHKPADALTIVSLMLRAGVSRGLANLINLLFSLMIPMGVGLFSVGLRSIGAASIPRVTSAALSFSAGTFLCIALSDLLPELQFHEHDRMILSGALLGGLALMGATALVG